jgi:hypothetical protein
MAGWDTPVRNAATNKRPCDQKDRWVFGLWSLWQGQHRSGGRSPPMRRRAGHPECAQLRWSAVPTRSVCHVPLAIPKEHVPSARYEHPRHSTAVGGDESVVTADMPFVFR